MGLIITRPCWRPESDKEKRLRKRSEFVGKWAAICLVLFCVGFYFTTMYVVCMRIASKP